MLKLRAYWVMQLLAPTTVIHFSRALLLHDMKSIFLKIAEAVRHLFPQHFLDEI